MKENFKATKRLVVSRRKRKKQKKLYDNEIHENGQDKWAQADAMCKTITDFPIDQTRTTPTPRHHPYDRYIEKPSDQIISMGGRKFTKNDNHKKTTTTQKKFKYLYMTKMMLSVYTFDRIVSSIDVSL